MIHVSQGHLAGGTRIYEDLGEAARENHYSSVVNTEAPGPGDLATESYFTSDPLYYTLSSSIQWIILVTNSEEYCEAQTG